MAGLGKKTFNAGEVLRAADVNGYLMDQTVQVYAGTAARGSAIGTAVSEGMVSYLADSNDVQVYDGSNWGSLYAPQGNILHNSGFDVWQRGAGAFTTANSYTADRWVANHVSGTSFSVSRSTDVPTGLGFIYSLSLTGTTDTQPYILQRIESTNAAVLANRTVTLSFYAKSTSGTASIVVNGAYANAVDNFTATTADVTGLTVTPSGNTSTSWTRYSVTFTVTSNAVNGYHIAILRNTTSASSVTLITGVQLEIGSSVTTFKRNGNSLQQEISTCQRYYWRSSGSASNPYLRVLTVTWEGASGAYGSIVLPTRMRATPSFSKSGSFSLSVGSAGTLALDINQSNSDIATVGWGNGSGGTNGYSSYYRANNDAAAYIELSAEL